MAPENLAKFPHKDGVNTNDWIVVHPNLRILAGFFIQFCLEHGLEICFTRIISEMIPGVSISNSHGDKGTLIINGAEFNWRGRAFDGRTRSWPNGMAEKFVIEANQRFNIGAISSADGKERESVYHNGTAMHLHNQVRP